MGSILDVIIQWTTLFKSICTFSNIYVFSVDILLVEALFFSLILFSPRLIRLRPSIEHLRPLLVLLPLILLMVRLFYHSGVVKLLSNDPLWLGQFVMDIHFYFLNPCLIFYLFICISLSFLNNLSPFITQLMFVIELVVPFGLLFSLYRRLSASILICFQCLIILTGNYGFFNFLVIVILFLPFFMSKSECSFSIKETSIGKRLVLLPIALILVLNSFYVIYSPQLKPFIFKQTFTQLRLFNGYGLFARMTTNQTRFNVFLSKDAILWDSVQLHYFDDKGYPNLMFQQPYHPRFRWQLWFKFIYELNYPYWYRNFIKLLATAPNQLPTIVRNADTLSNNYSFVKLCYQDIMFSLNGSKIDGYWHHYLNLIVMFLMLKQAVF